jgi:hypothetical protein
MLKSPTRCGFESSSGWDHAGKLKLDRVEPLWGIAGLVTGPDPSDGGDRPGAAATRAAVARGGALA